MPEILEKLFGSKERSRMLKFFLQNPNQEYAFAEVAKKNMLRPADVRKELRNFREIKFISERSRKGKSCFVLNQGFVFYPELKNLVAKSNIYPQCRTLGRIRDLGNVKYSAISGIFINYPKSKADMILVGDSIMRTKLKRFMESLEAEIGKEINFVLMTEEEFKYRLNMLDKFILEFLEGPHEELVNKLPGIKKFIANRR